MSSMQQPFNAGQSHGQAQAKTEEWIEVGKETANKAADATQSTHEAKQETSNFLQQTGQQMMHMAQGAVDTMKNTLGMNNNDKNN